MAEEYYLCRKCGLKYHESDLAEKCQEWCEENDGQCNPETTKHAIMPPVSLNVKSNY